MAVAWAASIYYVQYPEQAKIYLKNHHLYDFTYNKSLQKITESLKVDNKTKITYSANETKLIERAAASHLPIQLT